MKIIFFENMKIKMKIITFIVIAFISIKSFFKFLNFLCNLMYVLPDNGQ